MTARQRAAIRHKLIGIAVRKQRPFSGSSNELMFTRTTTVKYPDLRTVLSGIPWAVVGAAATRLYMPERFTQDLDIAINVLDSTNVTTRLGLAGCTHLSDLSIGGTSWRMKDGFPIDVIELAAPWTNEALSLASSNLDGQQLPVLTLPYLVLMKFESGRVQDIADVTRMLGQATDEQLDDVRLLFTLWAASESDDLESLIVLGQMETQMATNPVPRLQSDRE
jgi:hypothetical protein